MNPKPSPVHRLRPDSSPNWIPPSPDLTKSTYFGGGGIKETIFLESGSLGFGDAIVDLEVGGKIYVTGATASGSGTGTFPVSLNACQPKNHTSGISFSILSIPITAFASELDPSVKSSGAAQLLFSTLLGGTGTADAGTGLAIDSFGDMVISGLTYSSDFPVTTTAFQGSNNAAGASSTNAFLSVLYPLGTLCTFGGGTPVPTPSGSPSPSPGPSATPTPGGTIATSANPVVFPNAGLLGAPTHKAFMVQNLSGKHHLVGNVGAPSAEFSFVSGGGGFDLGPLGVKTVKLLFTPAGLGPRTGSLLVTSNDKLHPSVTVNLKGTGVPGVPSLSIPVLLEPPNPLSMTFGAVGIGVTGKTITLNIKNIGLGALFGSVAALAPPFAVTSPVVPFGPIATGAAQQVKVLFTPTAVGLATTTLTITTSNPNPLKHTLFVTVSGTGAPGRLGDQHSNSDDVHVAPRDARVRRCFPHRGHEITELQDQEYRQGRVGGQRADAHAAAVLGDGRRGSVRSCSWRDQNDNGAVWADDRHDVQRAAGNIGDVSGETGRRNHCHPEGQRYLSATRRGARPTSRE